MNVLWKYISPTRQGGPAVPKGKAGQLNAETSITRLLRLFALWKLVLFVIACLSTGPGYDTSTRTLLDSTTEASSWLSKATEHVFLRLTRWDAVYYASISQRGYVFEQEWAFRSLFTLITSVVARAIFWPFNISPIIKHAVAGTLASTTSHLLAVIALYALVYEMTPATFEKKRRLAFTTACLHIISPAGIFLQAPYSESTFALCNFMGMLCYALGAQSRFSSARRATSLETYYTVAAGIWFCVATMIRSNGFLSGTPFAVDTIYVLHRIWQVMGSKKTREHEEYERLLSRLIAVVIAGSFVALGLATPQLLGYLAYCTGENRRPWCSNFPPSIYSFVQEHYWDVGFLRYWKVSNLPLFALAFPMGWIMVETSFPSLFQAHHVNRVVNGSTDADQYYQPYPPVPATTDERVFQHCLRQFALPQLVLVGMAATSFHCQIINRISSGYPIWYLIIAIEIIEGRTDGEGQPTHGLFRMLGNYDRLPFSKPKWVVRGMVIYAMVQAALYASFLPPA